MDMVYLPREFWECPLFLPEVAFRLFPHQSILPDCVFWINGFRPTCSNIEVQPTNIQRAPRSSEYVGVHFLGKYNWATYHCDVTKGVSFYCLWFTGKPQIFSFCKLSSNRPFHLYLQLKLENIFSEHYVLSSRFYMCCSLLLQFPRD